jgi:hypothetical protein
MLEKGCQPVLGPGASPIVIRGGASEMLHCLRRGLPCLGGLAVRSKAQQSNGDASICVNEKILERHPAEGAAFVADTQAQGGQGSGKLLLKLISLLAHQDGIVARFGAAPGHVCGQPCRDLLRLSGFSRAGPDLRNIPIHLSLRLHYRRSGSDIQRLSDHMLDANKIRRGAEVEEQRNLLGPKISRETVESIGTRASPGHDPLLVVTNRSYDGARVPEGRQEKIVLSVGRVLELVDEDEGVSRPERTSNLRLRAQQQLRQPVDHDEGHKRAVRAPQRLAPPTF